MNEMENFVDQLLSFAQRDTNSKLTISSIQKIIKEMNSFLYTKSGKIGKTNIWGESFEYLSDFHKFWEENHKVILNAKIIEEQCRKVANSLHDVFVRTKGKVFSQVWSTGNVSNENICKIRFLTANQDFRGSRNFQEFLDVFNTDNSVFDVRKINEDPDDFVKSIKISNLSQNDKRISYAQKAAQFIIKNECEPIELAKKFNNDANLLRKSLINEQGMGYGNKKADMFIRDMFVLKIWPELINFDKIDVASDINTVKIALRTGILKTEIPLLSSFLDIFCYQYGYIDEMSANAWRCVWKIWNDTYPAETVASPALLDFFIYNVVGKQFCKDNLYIFEGDKCHHTFKWHSARNRTCQKCYEIGKLNSKAHKINQVLPCTDPNGDIAICQTEFVKSEIANPNYTNCPFKDICIANGTTRLQPPKSISIKGQTGWISAYTDKDSGGGGLMA